MLHMLCYSAGGGNFTMCTDVIDSPGVRMKMNSAAVLDVRQSLLIGLSRCCLTLYTGWHQANAISDAWLECSLSDLIVNRKKHSSR